MASPNENVRFNCCWRKVKPPATSPICLMLNPFLAFTLFIYQGHWWRYFMDSNERNSSTLSRMWPDDDISWILTKEIHQRCPACGQTLGNWINWHTKRLYFNLCVQLRSFGPSIKVFCHCCQGKSSALSLFDFLIGRDLAEYFIPLYCIANSTLSKFRLFLCAGEVGIKFLSKHVISNFHQIKGTV